MFCFIHTHKRTFSLWFGVLFCNFLFQSFCLSVCVFSPSPSLPYPCFSFTLSPATFILVSSTRPYIVLSSLFWHVLPQTLCIWFAWIVNRGVATSVNTLRRSWGNVPLPLYLDWRHLPTPTHYLSSTPFSPSPEPRPHRIEYNFAFCIKHHCLSLVPFLS